MKKKLYENIVIELLKIPERTLQNAIKESYTTLLNAAVVFQTQSGGYGLTLCSNEATKLIGRSKNIDYYCTLAEISKDSKYDREVPPTSIVSSACLAYLVNQCISKAMSRDDLSKLEHVHQCFDNINWMLGPDSVEHLGIKPSAKSRKLPKYPQQ